MIDFWRHKLFIRKYIYAILLLWVFFYLLHLKFSADQMEKVDIPDKEKGNNISLTVYMESQCPDTTSFIKKQLIPTFEKLKASSRIHYELVPFGKARCERTPGDFICTCQHGSQECLMNQLMNCVIDHFPSVSDYMPIIGCVQGSSSIDVAYQNCLVDNSEFNWLKTCAEGKRGRFLHELAGQKTTGLGPDFDFVPWIVIDGKRVNDAFYDLEENLCKQLEPRLVQCSYFV